METTASWGNRVKVGCEQQRSLGGYMALAEAELYISRRRQLRPVIIMTSSGTGNAAMRGKASGNKRPGAGLKLP